MYICLCKGITSTQLVDAVNNGAGNMKAVRNQLGVGTQCGRCVCEAKAIVKDMVASNDGQSEALFFELA